MMMTFRFFLLIALSFKVVSTNTLPTNGEYLNITNLDEILQALKDHNFEVAKWRDLCLDLGIYMPTLNGIEAINQHHGVDRCLQKCLSSWLSKADKVKQKGGPTWHSLIVGLRNTKEINTADRIHRNKHSLDHPACEIFDRYTSDSTIQENLHSLVDLLYAEEIVKKVTWPEDGKELLQDIGNSICVNYQTLETFAVVLQRSPATMIIALGGNILKEYERKFPKKEDMTSSDDKSNKIIKMSANERYEKMTEKKGIHLDIVNFTEVRTKYAATFDAVSKAIKSDDAPSLEELRTFLRRGHGYCKFPSQCESRKDIFDMIADECTLINIGRLESVVNFYNNEEVKQIIEQYKKYINDFNQMKLYQFLNEKFSDGSLLQSETALFYVDRSVKDSTLEDVRLLLATAFATLNQYVKVVVIREGNSYIITCSFPLHLSKELILSAIENIDSLKKRGLQRLTIGFSTVYDEVCEQEMEMDHIMKMEGHCLSVHKDARSSCGTLKQMKIYMSVKQLNEEDGTEIDIKCSDSGPSSWLLTLLLCLITTLVTIYVLFGSVKKRKTKSTQIPIEAKDSKKENKAAVADRDKLIAKQKKEILQLKEKLQSKSSDKGAIRSNSDNAVAERQSTQETPDKTKKSKSMQDKHTQTEDFQGTKTETVEAKDSKKENKAAVADNDILIAKLKKEILQLKEKLQSKSGDKGAIRSNSEDPVAERQSTHETPDEKSKSMQHKHTQTEDFQGVEITSDDAGDYAAPHTWRHFKRAPKEVMIIGSFGNHNQWKLPETTVSPKLIPVGLEGSYDEWIAEEVETIAEIYKKDPTHYELKDIPEKEQSRQYYLDKIISLFENCKKDEVLIYYTGHGEKDTGNWCFKDGVISFNDIFDLYTIHFRGKSLQIVSDCSYSGKWIYNCGKKLDEYGILSCGHQTREQGILFKIFTSCQPHEEATLLTFSRKGIRYGKVDKGVLIKYDEEIKMEKVQKGQNPMHVDFRHIHCYKMPGDQCELDSTCTWEDRLGEKRNHIIPLVDNKHEKFPSWYYLLIAEDVFDEFKDKQDKGNIGVKEATKYGKVLYSGPGKDPPSDMEKKLNLRFDMNTYASYKYMAKSYTQDQKSIFEIM